MLFRSQSSGPLPLSYLDDYGPYEKFIVPVAEDILSQRNVTVPFAFVGSILDEVCGMYNTCQSNQRCCRIRSLSTGRACGRNEGRPLPPGTQYTPDLFNENSMFFLVVTDLSDYTRFRLGIFEREARKSSGGLSKFGVQSSSETAL